jgi:hypothetical protein
MIHIKTDGVNLQLPDNKFFVNVDNEGTVYIFWREGPTFLEEHQIGVVYPRIEKTIEYKNEVEEK